MTADEAREQFSDACDGELSEERQRAFDALLEQDLPLAQEYASFQELVRATRAQAFETDVQLQGSLVEGVQHRIRHRSRGRFYRDRFAQRPGASWLVWLLVLMVLILGGAWLALYCVEVSSLTRSFVLVSPLNSTSGISQSTDDLAAEPDAR